LKKLGFQSADDFYGSKGSKQELARSNAGKQIGRPVNAARARNSSSVGGVFDSGMSFPPGADHAIDMPRHSRLETGLGLALA